MKYLSYLLMTALLILPRFCWAEIHSITIRISNHIFLPAEIHVPANTKIKLFIINEDNTAEEFESGRLNREKVIPGNHKTTIFIGPLAPGEYSFFGEFNPKTAQGVLIAK